MHIKNLKIFKTNLRKKYRGMREKIPYEKKELMDRQIARRFMLLDKYEKSKIVFTYVSKDIEVSTYSIINDAWKRKKFVAVPKCNVENKSMDFYFISSFDDLKKGTFGVYEPNELKCRIVTRFSEGICVVPGFCFDSFGYRLGYGHGYYDRFLTRFNGFTVGLCYSNCTSFKLPNGRYDRPVDILVTEKYVRRIYRIHKRF